MTIKSDFKEDIQNEIKGILNEDMADCLFKCFTGIMISVINSLSGFSGN